jgi:hypothetical protein
MRHYSISQWVDLARGLMPAAEGHAMAAHVDEGCTECQDLAEFSKQLEGVCTEMAALPVPDAVVRNAKAIFPIQRITELKRVPRIPARLVYDSLLAPEPSGLRATWQVGWQALYRAGDCSLDLRVEPELASTRAALIGQISNHEIPENQMENIPVYLKSGRSVVAETRSNRFGEFQMEYEQQGRLQLCVDLESGTKRFQVPLKKFSSENSLGGVDWVGTASEIRGSEQD